ncbi:MAG: hypothetical protein MRY83_20655, partial [Flavobacteriales bacterium]|nr:hypothetical protein [Flavobacteriales bacterium]
IILCFLPFLASFRDKNIEFVSPNHLTKNELVQGKPIYSVGNHDMRVIWAIGQQIIDFNFQDQKEVEYPIFFVTHQDQLAVQDLFESRSVQSLDTSGYHKQTNDYNLYSYLIEK